MTNPTDILAAATPEFAAWMEDRIPAVVQAHLAHFAVDRNDIAVDLTGTGPIFTDVTVAFPDPGLNSEERVEAVRDAVVDYLALRRVADYDIWLIADVIVRTSIENAGLARWVVVDDTPVPVGERTFRNPGTHATHCCTRHGCKYGPSRDCAVMAGAVEQEYPCERCGAPEEVPAAQIVALRSALNGVATWSVYGAEDPHALRALIDAAQKVIDGLPKPGKFDDYINPYAD